MCVHVKDFPASYDGANYNVVVILFGGKVKLQNLGGH